MVSSSETNLNMSYSLNKSSLSKIKNPNILAFRNNFSPSPEKTNHCCFDYRNQRDHIDHVGSIVYRASGAWFFFKRVPVCDDALGWFILRSVISQSSVVVCTRSCHGGVGIGLPIPPIHPIEPAFVPN